MHKRGNLFPLDFFTKQETRRRKIQVRRKFIPGLLRVTSQRSNLTHGDITPHFNEPKPKFTHRSANVSADKDDQTPYFKEPLQTFARKSQSYKLLPKNESNALPQIRPIMHVISPRIRYRF